MNFLFTCGGTAGHINPALAVAQHVKQKHPDAGILFVGAAGGMEENLVTRAGFTIKTVNIQSLRHKLTPSALWHNVKTVKKSLAARREAREILKAFSPDVVLGTGGYASYPVVREASKLGVPCFIHESNAKPGITTRVLARRCQKVLVSFEEAKTAYPNPERVLVTGTPVRAAFFETDKAQAKKALGLDERPVVLTVFGSLGARDMNKMMVDFIRLEAAARDVQHIHAAGKFGIGWLPDEIEAAGVSLKQNPQIRVQEYIYDMPLAMAAADLIIARSGASTLAELMAARKPAILVPSPNVTSHHQEKNADAFARAGAAISVPESALTGEKLFLMASELLQNRSKLDKLSGVLGKMNRADAVENIYRLLISGMESRKKRPKS